MGDNPAVDTARILGGLLMPRIYHYSEISGNIRKPLAPLSKYNNFPAPTLVNDWPMTHRHHGSATAPPGLQPPPAVRSSAAPQLPPFLFQDLQGLQEAGAAWGHEGRPPIGAQRKALTNLDSQEELAMLNRQDPLRWGTKPAPSCYQGRQPSKNLATARDCCCPLLKSRLW